MKLRSLFTAIMVAIPALAQVSLPPGLPKFQLQLVWDAKGQDSVLVEPFRRGAKIFSVGHPPRIVNFPEGLRVLTWHQGRFFALRDKEGTDKEGKDYEVALCSGKDPDSFQEVGKFLETAQNLPFDFLAPLGKEGLYLGACSAFGFVKDGKASVVGIFRLREDGKLVLEDVPDIRLERPLFRIGKPEPAQTFVALEPAYSALAPFLESLVQTPEFFILVSTRAGIIWVLDRENGSVRRTVNLYSVEDKDLGANSDLEHAILGIQPRSDGKVVIAARDEVAFRTSRKYFQYQKAEKQSALWEKREASEPPAPGDPEHRKREAFSALRTFGDILWWELDPGTGKLEQIHPEGAPTRLQTPQDLKRFRFHFEPGDKLKTSMDPAPAKAPQAEATPIGGNPKEGKPGPATPMPTNPNPKKPESLPLTKKGN